MTQRQRLVVLVCLLAVLSNIFWIEYLLYNQFTANDFWIIHIEPLAKGYLPGIVHAWVTIFIRIFIYPIVFWTLPILVYINFLQPCLRRYLLS